MLWYPGGREPQVTTESEIQGVGYNYKSYKDASQML
jgi:hypothetical protein